MRKAVILSILLLSALITFAQNKKIMPVADFATNFCRFPFAWEYTEGENVEIFVLSSDKNDSVLLKKIRQLSPGSELAFVDPAEYPGYKFITNKPSVVYLASELTEVEFEGFLNAMDKNKNSTLVIPAYFGAMDKERNYTPWIEFLNQASEKGAVIVGSHGDMYQLGDLDYWKRIPADIYTVMERKINGFNAMEPDFQIEADLSTGTWLAAGAVALLKSIYSRLTNRQIKEMLHEKSRKIFWSLIKLPVGEEGWTIAIPHLNREKLGKYEDEQIIKLERNTFQASSLDMMYLFDGRCDENGGWSLDVLDIKKAQQSATGKNITVAILDHSFNKNHPVLKDKYVSPLSLIEGVPALSEDSDHGTNMAEDLLMAAPDVNIIPVVVVGGKHWGDSEYFIKGINYAVENGADIISCSQGAIKGDQSAMDSAIRYAVSKGVSFVYINYRGQIPEVIVPRPVEFARLYEQEDIIYIIGTNFIRDDSPITWGVSHTAPIVSGVIALMKEKNPNLNPEQIKNTLLKSCVLSNDTVPLLNASKAIINAGEYPDPPKD